VKPPRTPRNGLLIEANYMRSQLRKIPPLLVGALVANSYGGGSTYIEVCVGQTKEEDSVIGPYQCP